MPTRAHTCLHMPAHAYTYLHVPAHTYTCPSILLNAYTCLHMPPTDVRPLAQDGNGVLDYTELAAGVSVLCGGSQRDRIRTAFELYDVECVDLQPPTPFPLALTVSPVRSGDGRISRGEMAAYLTAVFRLVLASEGEGEDQVNLARRHGPKALARAVVDECFQAADTDGCGRHTLTLHQPYLPLLSPCPAMQRRRALLRRVL